MASAASADRFRLTGEFTFAGLPAAPKLGDMAVVVDATETTVGAAADGGGAAKVLVWYNGTAWRIMGGTDT